METERNGKKGRNQILSLSLSLFLIFPSRPKFSPGGSPLKTNYDASRCPRIARERETETEAVNSNPIACRARKCDKVRANASSFNLCLSFSQPLLNLF